MQVPQGLPFNIAAFACGLFVLEYGADKFIDHTAIVAKRLRLSPTLIGLLTCGAEWEELVVVTICVSDGQSATALGNLIGSSIANIIGSFALGLLVSGRLSFDQSSKIYTAVQLGLTTLFLFFLVVLDGIALRIAGVLLMGAFAVYVGSVARLIYRGLLAAPESDSDSDSSSSSSDDEGQSSAGSGDETGGLTASRRRQAGILPTYNTASTSARGPSANRRPANRRKPKPRGAPKPLRHHVLRLLLGLGALILAGYVIAQTAEVVGEQLGLGETIVGTTILSLATTLPEKFVAVMGGLRRQPGIMVANTVGSNIFLATLCAGLLFVTGDLAQIKAGFSWFELGTMWLSAVAIGVMVVMGTNKWVGAGCLCAYIAFVVVELANGRSIDD